jgi:hypothetical protein
VCIVLFLCLVYLSICLYIDNLGNLLREDPTARGLLYLSGCFLPLMNLWTFKMFFDARYLVQGNDVFHQCYDMTALLALATAALHIRPVTILSNPVNNFDMFVFTISVFLAECLGLGRLLEIALCQRIFHTEGLYPEAFFAVRREALHAMPTVLFYMAAVIYLAVQYNFGHRNDNGGDETAYGAYYSYPSDEYAKEGNTSSTSHRSLASDGDKTTASYSDSTTEKQDDVAIWLLLAGFLIFHFVMYLRVVLCTQKDFKKYVFLLQLGTSTLSIRIFLEEVTGHVVSMWTCEFSIFPTHFCVLTHSYAQDVCSHEY